ncbi:MAG: transcriptional regulator [Deltaproteobacteria bacterium]|nr:transcriptional regulator [Deltaproteobacteria bacterium]
MTITPTTGTASIKREILSLKESQFCDFKDKTIKPAKLQQTFVGFANADGGEIFLGVKDPKLPAHTRIDGFDDPEFANEHINLLLSGTKPAVEGVEIEAIDFSENGVVYHIIIPKSDRVHYTSDDECYQRVNASTVKIKGDRIAQLGYAKGSYSYERVVVSHVGLLEFAASPHLTDYLQRIGSQQSPMHFLRKNRFAAKGEDGQEHPTVGAILLFDEEPQATLDTRCAIKVYRLQTTDSEYKREHLKEPPSTIEGPIERQIVAALDQVSKLLSKATVNVGGRIRPAKYPAEAIKEVLVNAVLHRDYSLNDDIHVRIYDNRIEIQSPGRLPGYITIKNILEERYARNSNIVRAIHKLPNPPNLDIGEGLNTAYNLLREAGLVEPTIQELDNAVLVTISHKRIASLEEQALEHLATEDTITNRQLRDLSGEDSENKVKKALQKLRKEEIIEVEDPDTSVFQYRYKLTEKGRKRIRQNED